MGKVRLSGKERDRLEILKKVAGGKLSRRNRRELSAPCALGFCPLVDVPLGVGEFQVGNAEFGSKNGLNVPEMNGMQLTVFASRESRFVST